MIIQIDTCKVCGRTDDKPPINEKYKKSGPWRWIDRNGSQSLCSCCAIVKHDAMVHFSKLPNY